jgi:hypothetical protein
MLNLFLITALAEVTGGGAKKGGKGGKKTTKKTAKSKTAAKKTTKKVTKGRPVRKAGKPMKKK